MSVPAIDGSLLRCHHMPPSGANQKPHSQGVQSNCVPAPGTVYPTAVPRKLSCWQQSASLSGRCCCCSTPHTSLPKKAQHSPCAIRLPCACCTGGQNRPDSACRKPSTVLRLPNCQTQQQQSTHATHCPSLLQGRRNSPVTLLQVTAWGLHTHTHDTCSPGAVQPMELLHPPFIV